MPKHAVTAAGEAMPAGNILSQLKGMLETGDVQEALSLLNANSIDEPQTQVDPLLDAIAAYKRGWREFMDTPDELSEEMCYLWRDPHKTLSLWEQPATTRKGALAALALAIEEEDIGDSPLTAPMMRAAMSFLESSASSGNDTARSENQNQPTKSLTAPSSAFRVMQQQEREREREQEMSDEDFAATEFDAWEHQPGNWVPPTNKEWTDLANPHLIMVRVAWMMMHKSKPELVDALRGMLRQDILETTVDGLQDTMEFFKMLHEVVGIAHSRAMVGAMNIALCDSREIPAEGELR